MSPNAALTIGTVVGVHGVRGALKVRLMDTGSDALAPGPALAATLGALLLQVVANFANDVFDAERGADTQERIGPPRAVATTEQVPRTRASKRLPSTCSATSATSSSCRVRYPKRGRRPVSRPWVASCTSSAVATA